MALSVGMAWFLEAAIVGMCCCVKAAVANLCWPSSTALAVGSLWCRPPTAVDLAAPPPNGSCSGQTSDLDHADGLARSLRIGDSAWRRGEPYTVVAIDRSLAPIAVTVQHQTTGAVVHTELSCLSLPCDCSGAPSLPLLRMLTTPVCGSISVLLSGLMRVLVFSSCLVRLTKLVLLVRLLGRRYRSDMAGDGPTTQGECKGRNRMGCVHRERPVPTDYKGMRDGVRIYRNWCASCHTAPVHRSPYQRPPPLRGYDSYARANGSGTGCPVSSASWPNGGAYRAGPYDGAGAETRTLTLDNPAASHSRTMQPSLGRREGRTHCAGLCWVVTPRTFELTLKPCACRL